MRPLLKRSIDLSLSFFDKRLLFTLGLAFLGCNLSVEKSFFNEGNRALESKNYPKAIEYFEKLVKGFPNESLALEGARQGAKAAAISKDYAHERDFLQAIIVQTKDPHEMAQVQRELAALFFEKMADYENAIKAYYKLFELNFSPQEKFGFRMDIAKAYFYLRDFKQALVEVDMAAREASEDDGRFQVEVLRGNILMAAKRMDEAVKVFGAAIEKYPEKAEKENLAVSQALCYEEKNDYNKAIEILTKANSGKEKKEFIEQKIKRLRERKDQLPGARGLHK